MKNKHMGLLIVAGPDKEVSKVRSEMLKKMKFPMAARSDKGGLARGKGAKADPDEVDMEEAAGADDEDLFGPDEEPTDESNSELAEYSDEELEAELSRRRKSKSEDGEDDMMEHGDTKDADSGY